MKGLVLHVVTHVIPQGTLPNGKGVTVPYSTKRVQVVLHVVLQGTLRNLKGVAVPVVKHVVLHVVLEERYET